MAKLIDLLHSLTEIIIRYHDIHVSKYLVSSEPLTNTYTTNYKNKSKLIIAAQESFEQELTELINKCTSNYSERKHLLNYLLNQIVFLNNLITKKSPLTPEALSSYKAQLKKMIIDFKQLLNLRKSNDCNVSYSTLDITLAPKNITLHGLLKEGYLDLGYFCDSGELINNFFMQRFHLEPKTSNIEIEEFINELCDNYQNSLFAKEKVTLETQIASLNHELFEIKANKSELEKTILEQEKIIAELEKTTLEQEKIIAELEKTTLEQKKILTEQEKAINQQKEIITKQDTSIKELSLKKVLSISGMPYSSTLFKALPIQLNSHSSSQQNYANEYCNLNEL